jgi:hypothetical protein
VLKSAWVELTAWMLGATLVNARIKMQVNDFERMVGFPPEKSKIARRSNQACQTVFWLPKR